MDWTRADSLAPLLLLLAACGAAVATRSDSNPSLTNEMARWRSYDWLPTPREGDPRLYNDIIRARLQRAVDIRLRSRGYRVDSGSPDFRIGWHASIENRMEVEYITDLYGYGWRVWYGPGSGTYVDEYAQGTLVLDFVDVRLNELAWRGVAEGRLSRARSALPTAGEVDAAVDELLDEFPILSPPRLR